MLMCTISFELIPYTIHLTNITPNAVDMSINVNVMADLQMMETL